MVGELLQKLYVGMLAPKGDIVQRLPYGIALWNVTGDLDLSEACLRLMAISKGTCMPVCGMFSSPLDCLLCPFECQPVA